MFFHEASEECGGWTGCVSETLPEPANETMSLSEVGVTGRLHVTVNLVYVEEFHNKSLDKAQRSALRPLACHELGEILFSTLVAQMERTDRCCCCVFDPVTTFTK